MIADTFSEKKYEDNPYPETGVPFFNAVGQEHNAPQTAPREVPGKREVG